MTQNSNDIARLLAEPFPEEMERVLIKSGVELIYLPISEVINRLNKVLGMNNWSFEIISVARDLIDTDEIIAHVSLMATIDGCTITKHGFGGQSVKRQRKDNKPVDLGNDFKGAVSDALKKAAQLLGVGLYLARSADAIDAEDAIDASMSQVEPSSHIEASSELDERWNHFVGVTKTLNKEQKDSLNDFWAEYSSGKPKPTRTTVTEEEIKALVVEAMRLSFGATVIESPNDN
jgi:hypothetical protein